MRSSKDRTIEKKRRSKAMKVQKTEASRRKRLANKAKREEIHAIDSSVKITIVNGIPHLHNKNGDTVELVNGIYTVVEDNVLHEEAYNAESDGGRAIDDQIEKERLYAFKALTDRLKKKKIEL